MLTFMITPPSFLYITHIGTYLNCDDWKLCIINGCNILVPLYILILKMIGVIFKNVNMH